MAVASKKETVHVFSLPKELALNGRSEAELKEELKYSLQSDEVDDINRKTIPESLLESRVNERPGFFGKYVLGKNNDKSYLKVYIKETNKTCAIVGNQLKILTMDGKLRSVDIQTQGHIYEDNKSMSTIELIKNDTNIKE